MNNKEQNNFNQEINKLEKKKLIELKEGMLYLNEEGMLLADSISQKLFLI